MSSRPKLILVHGWGLNSAIWEPVLERLADDFECIGVDLPGYGSRTAIPSCTSLESLAQDLIEQTDAGAHCCAWSLGGMAAIQAALMHPGHFKSLSLVCTTARFVRDDNWSIGMDMAIFQQFAHQLTANYQTGMHRFLLLQAGTGPQARKLANQAAQMLMTHPSPSPETLHSGLDILRNADLRNQIAALQVNTQIISGRRDRIVHPEAGKYLQQSLPSCQFALLNSGHAPHLSMPDEFCALLKKHLVGAEAELCTS